MKKHLHNIIYNVLMIFKIGMIIINFITEILNYYTHKYMYL